MYNLILTISNFNISGGIVDPPAVRSLDDVAGDLVHAGLVECHLVAVSSHLPHH